MGPAAKVGPCPFAVMTNDTGNVSLLVISNMPESINERYQNTSNAIKKKSESRTGGLFVSRLAPITSASALRRHIKDSCDVTVTCVSIKTKFDSYCSFRVFAEANLERLLTPSVWPSGVLVREFV